MTELPHQVAAAYDALADALEPLDQSNWDTASRCEGWRIRELVAHVTMPARYDGPAYLAELEAAGGDFTTVSNTIAERDGALPTTTLTAQLREPGLQQWTPPGGAHIGALNHVVVHGLDATTPLGIERLYTDETMRTILDSLTVHGVHQRFGVALPERLESTDVDWSYAVGAATGEPVRATAAELVMLLTGRAPLA